MAWYIAVSIAQENVVQKYPLECITEPCMIEIAEYIPTTLYHWQVNANNSHRSNGIILTITPKVILIEYPIILFNFAENHQFIIQN